MRGAEVAIETLGVAGAVGLLSRIKSREMGDAVVATRGEIRLTNGSRVGAISAASLIETSADDQVEHERTLLLSEDSAQAQLSLPLADLPGSATQQAPPPESLIEPTRELSAQ